MEHYLYLIIDLATLSIPFMASFYPKHAYYKRWKYLFPSLMIVGILFLIWDAYFTKIGVWGFNERYLTGIKVFTLPLEEVLFFVCIPYSSVFIFFSLDYLLKKDPLHKIHKYITYLLIILSIVLLGQYYDRWYTASTFGLLLLYLVYHVYRKTYLGRYYVSYAVTLVFFFVVNGILTGSWIDAPVVWYNNEENMALRLGTIPFEDIFYGFLLIALVLDGFQYLRKNRH